MRAIRVSAAACAMSRALATGVSAVQRSPVNVVRQWSADIALETLRSVTPGDTAATTPADRYCVFIVNRASTLFIGYESLIFDLFRTNEIKLGTAEVTGLVHNHPPRSTQFHVPSGGQRLSQGAFIYVGWCVILYGR